MDIEIHMKHHKGIFIIAEAGVNHNGSRNTAKKMVDAAVSAGADAVKFQTFSAERVATENAPKAAYQDRTTPAKYSQREMLRKLELNSADHKALVAHCRRRGIKFLSSPFDIESAIMLKRLGLDTFKIPSGEITNLPYLRKAGSFKKRIILSTGMANMAEVEKAVSVLVKAGTPKHKITVLHCNTEYPAKFEDVNLRAMVAMKRALGLNVGYSDHTPGIEAPIAAAALGASVVEKHFTLDRKMEGPDHKSSLEPEELKAMVTAVRNIEDALGDGEKRPSPQEIKNRFAVRKSIVASVDIRKGELLTDRNITAKRPASGLSPMAWDKVIGRKAQSNFKKDDFIRLTV